MNDKIKTAVVTGASSGIGFSVAMMLVKEGYDVYGIGRNFTGVKDEIEKEDRFHSVQLDLLNIDEITAFITALKLKHKVSILVNSAGVAYYGPFEDIKVQEISEMVNTNLLAPMVITKVLMKDIKESQGYIINISSVTAEMNNNTHGVSYGATKAGLTSFSRSLFSEVRKYGVKVINVEPDLTDTALYRNADFKTSEVFDERLLSLDVAECVKQVINMRDGAVITDITVRPQKNKIVRKNR